MITPKEQFKTFYRLIRTKKGYNKFFDPVQSPKAKRMLWFANRVYISCH